MFTTFLPIATWTNLQGQQFLISVKLSLLIQDLPDVLGIALYTFLSIAIWTDLQRQQFFLLPSITFVDEVNVHIHSYLNWFARAAVLLPSWNNLTFVEEVHVTSSTFRIVGKLRCFCFCSQFGGSISFGWGGSMISIILLGDFRALTFTGLITFFLEPNIFVIYLITLLIKPALGLRPEPFHSSLWLLSFSVPSKQAQVMQPNIQMNSWSGEGERT